MTKLRDNSILILFTVKIFLTNRNICFQIPKYKPVKGKCAALAAVSICDVAPVVGTIYLTHPLRRLRSNM